MKLKKRVVSAVSAAGASVLLLAGCAGPSSEAQTMVTVVKLSGVGWFDRMEEGVAEFAAETGIDARQEGADDASPEKQLALIQNILAQSPTGIVVVPNSPEALEDIFKQARDAGVIVVTHEAAGMTNVDADIEAFDNTWYGAQIMTNLAACMGEEGKYVSFVGGLTAKTHMTWVEGAYQEQMANFPNLVRVEDPIESKEDETVAYERAKEILAKYPDIKGFQGSAGTDVAGIGRAVQEAGLQDQVCVMGTSIPSVASKYLEDGSIDKIFFWDPALAGKAALKMTQILADGGQITEGTDLGIVGYNSLKKLAGYDNVWAGEAAVIVDMSNVSDYNF
jgi:simple sugar transport system substrate-binding protein